MMMMMMMMMMRHLSMAEGRGGKTVRHRIHLVCEHDSHHYCKNACSLFGLVHVWPSYYNIVYVKTVQ